MKAATQFIIAIVSIWFVDALPFPQFPLQERGGERGHIQSPDVPYFTYGRQMQQDEDEVIEDEEDIDEKIGLSEFPNVIGDMVLTPEQLEQLESGGGLEGTAQGLKLNARHWPNAVFPYKCDENLGSRAVQRIRNAINELGAKSCIQFVEVTDRNFHQYRNYVRFFAGNGCWSYLGMRGGEQPISIGRGCDRKGIIQHEIFHALGRVHEQSRPDRDQYVTIYLQNVESKKQHNFRIIPSDTQNLSYDYGSVMHYGRGAFSIRRGDPNFYTIVPKQHDAQIGQRRGLSPTDWNHLNEAYCS